MQAEPKSKYSLCMKRAARSSVQTGAGLGSVLGLLMVASACFGPRMPQADERFKSVTADVAFVGNASCATCHEDIATSYKEHGMAQSFYRMASEHEIEPFPSPVVIDSIGGYRYQAVRRDTGYVQIETLLGPDSLEIHRLERPMTYVVGGGGAARTYLAESNGHLYELPLTYYTQTSTWGMSPGYEVVNPRFDRSIPEQCMTCHNGISEAVDGVEGKYSALANGIECEQCHGPGQLHVEAREAEEQAPDSIDYTIVNPKYLSLDLRLDVCQQCHLNGQVSLLREGESGYSYRPGRPLSAHRALYMPEVTDPNQINVVSHAARMRSSACFTESGTMDCVTCHNPHEGFRDQGPEYFNKTCRTCHEPATLSAGMPTEELKQQHDVAANCTSCHMPKVKASDVIHAAFTDHKIRVVTAGAPASVSATKDAHLVPYFDVDDGNAVLEGMAYVVYSVQMGPAGAAAKQRGISLLQDALKDDPDVGEGQFLLGIALYQSGKAREAVGPLQAAIALQENPERLNALAQAYEAVGRPASDAEPLYRRALEIQPAAASVRVNLARLLEAQNRLPSAIAEYEAAIQEEPWLVPGHVLLGGALAKAGQIPNAITRLREAVTLDPVHADALTNLGALLAQTGSVPEGGRYFERAVRAEPQNANALGNLALYTVSSGRPEAALRIAEQALQINPQQGTALQVMEILRQSAR